MDDAGNVLETFDYYPFGLLMPKRSSTTGNTIEKFTGKERDEAIGLDYFGARYLDPALGRWLSVDPLASDYPSLSPYNYVENDPINLIDPDGRISCEPDDPCPELIVRAVTTILFDIKHAAQNLVLNDPILQSITGVSPGEGKKFEAGFATNENGEEVFETEIRVVDEGGILEEGVNNLLDAAMLAGGGGPAGLLSKSGGGKAIIGSAKEGINLKPTRHSILRKTDPDRAVRTADELDAFRNPLQKGSINFDNLGRPSQKFIGRKGTIVINPKTGSIITVYPTSSKTVKKLK